MGRQFDSFPVLLSGTLAVLLCVFLILSPIYVVATPQFVRFEYSRSGFPPAYRFKPDARYYAAVQTLRYVRGETSLADLRTLGIYNEREIRHLVDMRKIVRAVPTVHCVSGILALIVVAVLSMRRSTYLHAARGLVRGAGLTLGVIALVGAFAFLSFDRFFVAFHTLFFEGNSWRFAAADSLLQLYPEPYWRVVAYVMALLASVAAAGIGAVGWGWVRHAPRKSPTIPAGP